MRTTNRIKSNFNTITHRYMTGIIPSITHSIKMFTIKWYAKLFDSCIKAVNMLIYFIFMAQCKINEEMTIRMFVVSNVDPLELVLGFMISVVAF